MMKGKVYKTVIKLALALSKGQEKELEVAELKMLRYSLGVTKLEKIRSEYIRGTAHVRRFRDKQREGRLRWYGHIMRRDGEYIGKKIAKDGATWTKKKGKTKEKICGCC